MVDVETHISVEYGNRTYQLTFNVDSGNMEFFSWSTFAPKNHRIPNMKELYFFKGYLESSPYTNQYVVIVDKAIEQLNDSYMEW